MKVLSIGTDRGLFKEGSASRERSLGYSEKTEQFHAVVFTLRKEGCVEQKVGNLFVYPTNSVSQWFYVLDAYRLCKKIITNNGLTKDNAVISTQDPFQTGFVGVGLSKKFDLPLQVQIHTDFLSHYFSGFFNGVRKIIAGYVIPKAQGIRVVSSVISDSLRLKFPNLKADVSILPVFVDVEKIENIVAVTDRADTGTFPFSKKILMISRLTKEKRFDVALKAMKNVVEKVSDVGLVIFGSGPEKENIEKMVNDFGLEEKVKLMGWTTTDDIWKTFFSKTSDIGITPA